MCPGSIKQACKAVRSSAKFIMFVKLSTYRESRVVPFDGNPVGSQYHSIELELVSLFTDDELFKFTLHMISLL